VIESLGVEETESLRLFGVIGFVAEKESTCVIKSLDLAEIVSVCSTRLIGVIGFVAENDSSSKRRTLTSTFPTGVTEGGCLYQDQ